MNISWIIETFRWVGRPFQEWGGVCGEEYAKQKNNIEMYNAHHVYFQSALEIYFLGF